MDIYRVRIYGYIQSRDIWTYTEEGYMDIYRVGI